MKCADIMSKNLEWLNEKDTVRQAAAVMADAGIGFLPICDKWKKVVGVVTDRDLATRGLAKKVDPGQDVGGAGHDARPRSPVSRRPTCATRRR